LGLRPINTLINKTFIATAIFGVVVIIFFHIKLYYYGNWNTSNI
jgi:hypothetical protein